MKVQQCRIRNSIIIFGGAFAPFHNGHAKICSYLTRKNLHNKLIIVPSFAKFYQQDGTILASKWRIQIIKLMLAEYKLFQIDISLFELNRQQNTPTYITINYFAEKYPQQSIFFVIGDDNLVHIDRWEYFSQFYHKYKFVILRRSNTLAISELKPITQQFYRNAVKVANPFYDYSSTEIRNGRNLAKYNQTLLKFLNSKSLFWAERLKAKLSSNRQVHSFNVATLAVFYGKRNGVNYRLLFFAGIYHDWCKNIGNINSTFQEKYLDEWAKKFGPPVWHGVFMAKLLAKEWSITNNNVLLAIRHHTMPSLNANLFQKIIYCADKLSHERTNKPYLKTMRHLAKTELTKAFWMILYYELKLLITSKKKHNPYFGLLAAKYFPTKEAAEIQLLLNSSID